MTRALSFILIVTLSTAGCATSSRAPATAPSSRPAAVEAPPLQSISLVRTRVNVRNDVLKIVIEPDGSYVISRRGGGGANSSTRGRLTDDQKRRLAEAFSQWDKLESYYSPPGGTEEEFRFELAYGEKLIIASDAALHLPATFREAYRQLRDIVSAAGML